MLTLIIPGNELFDENTQEFSTDGDLVLELEHSLVSLSKWESEFQKPFLSSIDKQEHEILGYIKHMLLTNTQETIPFEKFTQEHLDQINKYINSTQSATTFGIMPERKGHNEVITSELIYYWLVAFTIPFECQHWHLNRLFALIRICNIKNAKPKKMSRHEMATRNRELNAQRKAQLNTTG
jgi:hypothetical protein